MVGAGHRPGSIPFPMVHIFPTILCYVHLYLTQRERRKALEINVKVSAWESLLFMTLSAPWPACEHLIWERAMGATEKAR